MTKRERTDLFLRSRREAAQELTPETASQPLRKALFSGDEEGVIGEQRLFYPIGENSGKGQSER